MKKAYPVKTAQIMIRLEDSEKEFIESAAKKVKKRPARFVRDAALKQAAHDSKVAK